ncbi:MAG: ribonuclease R [Methylacidiphilales bacterium]|nr:ribonuclease R [Candidatus Methylacidiphilales bacterium]
MPSKTDLSAILLRLMAQPGYQPLNENQLERKLKLSEQRRKELPSLLQKLELDGQIARIRKDCWVLPQEAELVTGVINFNEKGFAFLIREDKGEDLYIAAEDTGTAMHQDVVVARIQPAVRGGRFADKKQARVIRILKRRRTTLVGTLEKSGRFYYVVPSDRRYIQNVYVPQPSPQDTVPNVQIDDKVVVRLEEWTSRHLNPEGVIIERLGRTGDPGLDILSIIRKHELPDEFPSAVLAELASFQKPEGDAKADDLAERLDLRHDFIITIDPDTAKDFDDAISVRRMGRDLWEVGIHIADVSHYVRPGSELDKEAAKRGNSVYLVNQVIPMLPEELSNGLCSLNPHVDRLTYSVMATLDQTGHPRNWKITRSIIHSKHRLSYQQAFTRLQRKPQDALDTFLHDAWKIASVLRSRRFAGGALDLEMPEVKVYCDEQGRPTSIQKVENDISHQLIEEFMLLANEIVATDLKRSSKPAIYRIHESPDPEKLLELREILKIHGVKVGDMTQKREVQKALKLIEGLPEQHALKVAVLRSFKRAIYDTRPIGHYGLAKSNYTHFTSPIRRYSDLIVHRALALKKKGLGYPSMDELTKLAKYISQTERSAAEAEEESIRLKKFEFFAAQLNAAKPQSFPAIIMDVQNFGMFVELPDFLLSGLVHVSAMKDDFYYYDERSRGFVGKKTRRKYTIGQTVKVRVERIDPLKQQIDFRLG